MTTFTETRYIGVEQCPNGPTVHVVPMTITSSVQITNLETPGNITAVEVCAYCNPRRPDPSEES